jgi:hypothetical protein
MQGDQRHRGNYLSIGEPCLFADMQALIMISLDGGASGLPALFILEELLSRLAYDLKLDTELLPWRHFDIIIGTGPGG